MELLRCSPMMRRIGSELKSCGAMTLHQLLGNMPHDTPSEVYRNVEGGVRDGLWTFRKDGTLAFTDEGMVAFANDD